MTKSDLYQKLGDEITRNCISVVSLSSLNHGNLKKQAAKLLLDKIFNALSNIILNMKDDDKIFIPEIGSFMLKTKKEQSYKIGDKTTTVPKHKALYFKPTVALKNSIKAKPC